MIHRFLVGHSLQTLQVASSEKKPAATENLPSCVFAVVLVTFTVAARGSLFSNAWAKERFQIGKPGGAGLLPHDMSPEKGPFKKGNGSSSNHHFWGDIS